MSGSTMRKFFQRLGFVPATIACMLAAFWVLGLIVLPQATMIERSLWWEEQPADLQDAAQRLDQAWIRQAELSLEDPSPERDAELAAVEAEIQHLETLDTAPVRVWGLNNYVRMSGLHLRIFLWTLAASLAVTLIAFLVCYPVAWAVATAGAGLRGPILLMGLIVPYAVNELLRIFAWLILLDREGLVNTLLQAMGLPGIPFVETGSGVFITMVYTYVLFMVFPMLNSMETLDRAQVEAARDLGASILQIHRRVVIPHSRPGIAIGCIMTFMLAAGSYAVPWIMSRGVGGDWFTQLVYRQFYEADQWNVGAAYAVTLLIACLAFVLLVMKVMRVSLREIAR
jgi:spermidine/putrescine transport system permease protein